MSSGCGEPYGRLQTQTRPIEQTLAIQSRREASPFDFRGGPINGYSGYTDTLVVMQVKKPEGNQIALSLGRPPVTIVLRSLVLLVERGHFRSWTDGFLTGGAEGGLPSPWLTRC